MNRYTVEVIDAVEGGTIRHETVYADSAEEAADIIQEGFEDFSEQEVGRVLLRLM
jgi:hypothetical protein